MSLSREIVVFCDKCGEWERVMTAKVSTARRAVKKKGWRRMKDQALADAGWSTGFLIDVCPGCQNRRADEED